ncbi:MAG: enoyl-CoA hydratase/isomerase family protein [Bacteroidota bacterium]|jgi:enoyl-CoA hydratase
MYQTLLTELEHGILTVTVNRPDKLNALNRSVFDDLNALMDQVDTDPAIRGVILTGSGPKAFVAGADISEFTQLSKEEAMALAKRGQDCFFRLERSRKPIIAAVNGFALGGGCELAMSCHIRLASENARFGQPEVNLGLIPGYGGTQRLTQLIGKGRAMELMMSGNMLNAADAHRVGLVNHVFTADTLLEESKKLLTTILSKGPNAVGRVIAAVNAAGAPDEAGYKEEVRLFGECFGTPEMQEGVGAFLEKRTPKFS